MITTMRSSGISAEAIWSSVVVTAQDLKRAPKIFVPLTASLHRVAADSNPAQAANVMGPLTGSPDVHSSASASLFHQQHVDDNNNNTNGASRLRHGFQTRSD
jgi:hypothetical protein